MQQRINLLRYAAEEHGSGAERIWSCLIYGLQVCCSCTGIYSLTSSMAEMDTVTEPESKIGG